MDSQSSFTMAFRAIVMLSCLILVPLVALFGTSLPETIKRLVQRQLDGNTASAASSFSEIFAFLPAGNQAVSAPPASAMAAPGPPAVVMPASEMAIPGAPAPLLVPPGAASPLVAAPNGIAPGSYSSPTAPPTGPWPVVPAGYTAPVQPMAGAQTPNTLPAVATMGMPAPGVSSGDRFTCLKDRLRELGANYYLLETWGSQGQLFRFYCKIAIGGSPNYARYFEATDADPLRAMSAVLEQVEAWRMPRP